MSAAEEPLTPKLAVERAVGLMAEASARVLGMLSGGEARVANFLVEDGEAETLSDLTGSLVSARVAFVGAVEGDNVFLIASDQARRLADAMTGGALGEGEPGSELGEIELSAIAEAMNQMMGGACGTLADELAIDADIAPPTVEQLEDGMQLGELAEGSFVARFVLEADGVAASIVQVIPAAFAGRLYESLSSADQMREVVENRPVASRTDDATLRAVERTARISAEAAATVLSTLLGEEASATLPTIEVDPDDPLAKLSFPLVAVEVSYVSGVTGNNLFVLSPDQAARLAAIMMALEEPMGDGLSEIELSAVSESMNQMMGAATNVMADTLTMDIEVSPPVCTVLNTIEEAHALFSDCAFCSRFRLISGPFTADVMQLVSADFAAHLRQAFETADAASAVVNDIPLSPSEAVADAGRDRGAAPTGWGDVAAPAAHDHALLRDIKVRLSAELGRAQLPVGRVANLPAGAVVKLDRQPADGVDVLVNGCLFARAQLVLVDGEYAVQILSLMPPEVAA